ncbi:MAG: UvrD-helicase domain-containing protein [Candidatus Sericytochromatia bacterium]|nr:UvrD-helicase domain-containing protein [Candidatus Sericytochromatia bacterium]
MPPPTITVAISEEFFDALLALPRNDQRRVKAFIREFRANPKAPGINYERINQAADPKMRSARVNDDFRCILLAPEAGNVYILLWVDHHDDAYTWARRRRAAIHPQTGALQLFEVTSLEAGAPRHEPRAKAVESAAPPLFVALDDETLSNLGVPEATLPLVRAMDNAAALEAIRGRLPAEAYEALTLLSLGFPLDEVLESRQAPALVIDPDDYAAALRHPDSRRRFQLLTDDEALEAILGGTIAAWRTFLHPSQRELVERNFSGPAYLTGGAGTGKTVVLMHRARHLASRTFPDPDARILVLTYTKTLAGLISDGLDAICGPERHRIQVLHLHQWARDLTRGLGRTYLYPRRSEEESCWSQGQAASAPSTFDVAYMREEWEGVIQAESITTLDEYMASPRVERSDTLTAKDRESLWRGFEAYRTALRALGGRDHQTQLVEVLNLLPALRHLFPYRAVLVDEAQDMGAIEWRIIRQIVPPAPNDLFIAGDPHQRIFPRSADLRACGIDVVGRTFQLRLNYRTTLAIQRWAVRSLAGHAVADLHGGFGSLGGYKPLRDGPQPEVMAFASKDAETAHIVSWVAEQSRHCERRAICVMAQHRDALRTYRDALAAAGIPSVVLGNEEPAEDAVHLCSMRRAKGLEFKGVVLAGLDNASFPPRAAGAALGKEELNRHRRLLYAAASRARDTLLVTCVGTPTVLLGRSEREP